MDFETFVRKLPKLHSWDGGKTSETGGFKPDELRVFHRLVSERPDAAVIETGCGNSSLAFLLSGVRRLVSIDIERDVPDRICRYCGEHGIDNAMHELIIEPSEWALPKLAAAGNRFDIALIDGCHGWPAVFVDFCYMNVMLSKNAILIVDDVQLYSVSEIANWLQEQYEFEKIDLSMPKTLVFRKTADIPIFNGWGHQPYITRMSGLEYRDEAWIDHSTIRPSIKTLLEENYLLKHDLQAIVSSTSWKLTWPLRWVASRDANLRRILRAPVQAAGRLSAVWRKE